MLLIKQKKYEEEKKNYTFKPNINTEYNFNNIFVNGNNKTNNNINNIDNNMNRNIYSDLNNYFKTENSKLKNNLKNNNSFQTKKQYNPNSLNNTNSKIQKNNELYRMLNNQNNKKIQIPYSSKNNYNNNISNAKLQHFYHPRQLSASKSSNNCNLNNIEDNKNIFINLFNDLDTDKDNVIVGNSLNTNKIPKNILRIINPLINGILKDKIRPITRDEFIFYMNNIFNNMSPIDKRLLIYTYNNNNQNKNKLFMFNYNNYSNSKKTAHTMRPGTPNYSMRSIHNKKDKINNNYGYNNYYNNDKNKNTNIFNNNINNYGFHNSRTQKNIDKYLYGNNSHYYYGF